MNKTHHILLFTILLMAGCNKPAGIHTENINGESGSYIFFDAGLTATKGALISGNTLPTDPGTSFGVYGFRSDGKTSIFNKYKTFATGNLKAPFENVAKVYRPDTNNDGIGEDFTYDALALWHSGNHSFYAYYPYESTPSVITGIGNDPTNGHYLTYTQPTSLSDMVDVMTASSTDATASTNGVVSLEFAHRLSALDLVVKNNQTESRRDIKIKSAYIKIQNIPSDGTLYFNGTTIPNNASFTVLEHTYDIVSPITITYDNTNEENSRHNLNSSSSFLFLPCDSIVATVTLTIINSWDEEVQLGITSQSLAPANGFIAGNRYYLIITKTEAGVEFRLDWANANGDWTDGPDPSFDFS